MILSFISIDINDERTFSSHADEVPDYRIIMNMKLPIRFINFYNFFFVKLSQGVGLTNQVTIKNSIMNRRGEGVERKESHQVNFAEG